MINHIFFCLIHLIIFLVNFHFSFSKYIAFPLKRYFRNAYGFPKKLYSESSLEDFINDYLYNDVYTPIKMGSPSQDISAILNSLEFEFLIYKEKKWNLKSSYSKASSSSFKLNQNHLTDKDLRAYNYISARENFDFCDDFDLTNFKCNDYKQCQNINFALSHEDQNANVFSYLEFGLNVKSHYNNPDEYSLINELIVNKFVKEENWFIYCPNCNNSLTIPECIDYDSLMIVGSKPSDYLGKKYKEKNMKSCQGVNTKYDYRDYWSIVFAEVKQKSIQENKELEKVEIIEKNIQGVINFNYNLIIGNEQYLSTIRKTFFNFLINKGKCAEKLVEGRFILFYCYKSQITREELDKIFPILLFKQIEMEYIFELNSKDLFLEIGEHIFFLIVFNQNTPTKSFLLGKIFLSKYLLNFDINRKRIQFYPLDVDNPITSNKGLSFLTFTIFLILLIIFLLVGFILGKKIYRQRKLRANELEDQFAYSSNFSEDNKKGKFNLGKMIQNNI